MSQPKAQYSYMAEVHSSIHEIGWQNIWTGLVENRPNAALCTRAENRLHGSREISDPKRRGSDRQLWLHGHRARAGAEGTHSYDKKIGTNTDFIS